MGGQLRWRAGAYSAGILLACAIGACSDSTEPSPGPGPSSGCSATVQLSESTVDLAAKQIRLTIATPPSCQWFVTTPTWVSVVSKHSGSGSYSNGVGTGEVTLWLQVAAATSARQGWIAVRSSDGNTGATLYQEAECVFRTDPHFLESNEAGGRRSVGLTTLPTCAWSFDMPAWIRVEPSSGTGSATLTIDVSPTDSPRAGVISTAGRSIGVRQTPAGMSSVVAFATLGCGTLRPGERRTGLCYYEVVPATNPTSSQVSLTVDLRALGWGDNYTLNPDIGTSGLGFFVDVRVEASVVPGVKAIPLTARDAQGRTTTAVAMLSILPPK